MVSICGKYRTGKSYLLNKLFMERLGEERAKRGFNVGPTINPCTKGLWIWKEVFFSPADEECKNPIIVIDTEGLAAFDEDTNHDTKIFLLALLLSSCLVYNSTGTIDEGALNTLSLVLNLAQQLQVNKGQQVDDPEELAKYFPSFLWVIRDSFLKKEDEDGNKISSKKYLENSLKDIKGVSEQAEQKNRIRRQIRAFFTERDCHTLVRPTEDEAQLQRLNELTKDQLRPEFNTEIEYLRTKVFNKAKPKNLKGKDLSGPMLLELAQAYVDAINGGSIPVIESAWDYMQVSELQNAFKEVEKKVDINIKNL